ncbi:MAG: bifunctional aminoglycoside phosphotransferase/ATP-binding protein [Actinomycetota bacterium]
MGKGPAAAAVRETHVSWIFLVGDRAYKAKKPVALPFVDLSTPALRSIACHREVELNRRFASDVYEGVGTFHNADGTTEPVVVMKRMPDDRRLSVLCGTDADLVRPLREIARAIVTFHGHAPRSAEIDAAASQIALRSAWSTNATELGIVSSGILPAELVRALDEEGRRYIDGRAPLFEKRIAERKIADLHGDLLADDIYVLHDGPRILDCLEFDDHMRYGDVLSDVTFLAMDLERLGRTTEATVLVDAFRRFSNDDYPESLAHHYIAFRAAIRAKVACLRARGGDDVAAAREAVHLAGIGLLHAHRARVTLTLLGGLPGTGKSTLADHVSAETGAVVLRSDEIRKELWGLGHDVHATAPYRAGIYAPDTTRAVYREMLQRADTLLGLGQSVVCDASWSDAAARDHAAVVARRRFSDIVELRCDAPAEVAFLRIENRNHGPSDADRAVATEMAAHFDAWPHATVIDTDAGITNSLLAALAAIRRPPQEHTTLTEQVVRPSLRAAR